jgi:hypothetical protein
LGGWELFFSDQKRIVGSLPNTESNIYSRKSPTGDKDNRQLSTNIRKQKLEAEETKILDWAWAGGQGGETLIAKQSRIVRPTPPDSNAQSSKRTTEHHGQQIAINRL